MSEQLFLHFRKRFVGDLYVINEKSLFLLVLTLLTCSPRLVVNMVNNAMLQWISRYHRLIRRTQLRLLNSHKIAHFSGLISRDMKREAIFLSPLLRLRLVRKILNIAKKNYYQSNFNAAGVYFTMQWYY